MSNEPSQDLAAQVAKIRIDLDDLKLQIQGRPDLGITGIAAEIEEIERRLDITALDTQQPPQPSLPAPSIQPDKIVESSRQRNKISDPVLIALITETVALLMLLAKLLAHQGGNPP